MKTRSEYIALLQSRADILREYFGVHSLRLFGSVARGDQKSTSDVDVCVEMEPRLYLFVELGMFLEELLGCHVDVVRMICNRVLFLKEGRVREIPMEAGHADL